MTWLDPALAGTLGLGAKPITSEAGPAQIVVQAEVHRSASLPPYLTVHHWMVMLSSLAAAEVISMDECFVPPATPPTGIGPRASVPIQVTEQLAGRAEHACSLVESLLEHSPFGGFEDVGEGNWVVGLQASGPSLLPPDIDLGASASDPPSCESVDVEIDA